MNKLLLCLGAWLFAHAAWAQSSATFFIRAEPGARAAAVWLNTTFGVRAGSVALRLDPEVFTIDRVLPGQALRQFPNPQIFSNILPFDDGGNPLPGGALIAWLNSPTNQDVLLESGEHEVLVLELSPEPPAGIDPKNCASIEFLPGLRPGPDGDLQLNAVTADGTATLLADTRNGEICACEDNVQITPAGLPAAFEGASYSARPAASGGAPPYRWSVQGGIQNLPSGLILDPDTGALSGTAEPGSAGPYTFVIQACDACSRGPRCASLEFTLQVLPRRTFHRGDPNNDGKADISDGIVILTFLFLGGDAAITCRETADTNNSSNVDISDGIFLLTSLFIDGSPLPEPGAPPAACGFDPDPPGSGGDIGCDSYPPCL